MITLIRITGLVGMKRECEETFNRLRLRTKFSCVVLKENAQTLGMLKDVKDFVAFGTIDEKMLTKMIAARGKKIGNVKAKFSETESAKIAKEFVAGKSFEELKVRPWFGLHPARGGINSKLHYPRGVIGNHKEKINELIERML
jgi:large subunit ribosomal protein L30